MQDIIADFLAWLFPIFAIFDNPPLAAVLIVSVSVTTTTLSQLMTKRFTDMKRLQRYQAEVKQHQAMQKEAEKTQNTKMLKKVRRRKAYIDRIQREMMTDRCKPSLFLMVPMLLVFSLLRAFYSDPITGLDSIVVVLPFNVHKLLPFLEGMIGYAVPGGFGMTFWGFYFLVGLGLSGIIQRIFGTQMSMT